MGVNKKIRRTIAFSPTTWERLEELSDRMDTPISTLVNLGIAWWIDYHEGFKMLPELLASMNNVEGFLKERLEALRKDDVEGDST
jgi:predicted DNA-binding protein